MDQTYWSLSFKGEFVPTGPCASNFVNDRFGPPPTPSTRLNSKNFEGYEGEGALAFRTNMSFKQLGNIMKKQEAPVNGAVIKDIFCTRVLPGACHTPECKGREASILVKMQLITARGALNLVTEKLLFDCENLTPRFIMVEGTCQGCKTFGLFKIHPALYSGGYVRSLYTHLITRDLALDSKRRSKYKGLVAHLNNTQPIKFEVENVAMNHQWNHGFNESRCVHVLVEKEDRVKLPLLGHTKWASDPDGYKTADEEEYDSEDEEKAASLQVSTQQEQITQSNRLSPPKTKNITMAKDAENMADNSDVAQRLQPEEHMEHEEADQMERVGRNEVVVQEIEKRQRDISAEESAIPDASLPPVPKKARRTSPEKSIRQLRLQNSTISHQPSPAVNVQTTSATTSSAQGVSLLTTATHNGLLMHQDPPAQFGLLQNLPLSGGSVPAKFQPHHDNGHTVNGHTINANTVAAINGPVFGVSAAAPQLNIFLVAKLQVITGNWAMSPPTYITTHGTPLPPNAHYIFADLTAARPSLPSAEDWTGTGIRPREEGWKSNHILGVAQLKSHIGFTAAEWGQLQNACINTVNWIVDLEKDRARFIAVPTFVGPTLVFPSLARVPFEQRHWEATAAVRARLGGLGDEMRGYVLWCLAKALVHNSTNRYRDGKGFEVGGEDQASARFGAGDDGE